MSRIIKWFSRFLPSGLHDLYIRLSLSVKRICEYDKIFTNMIILCYIRLFSQQEEDSPVGFHEVSCQLYK